MSVAIPVKAIETISKAKDPKKAIFDLAGDLDQVEVIGDMVLVGIYVRPEKTKGGIFLADVSKEEDIWQGKVGLVMKWGPDAFRNEEGEVYEQAAEIGEWVVFKVGDGWQFKLNDASCRLVRDTSIRMKIKDPTIII